MKKRKVLVSAALLTLTLAVATAVLTRDKPDVAPVDGTPGVSGAARGEQEIKVSSRDGDVLFHHGAPSGLLRMEDGTLLIADTYNKAVWRLREGGEAEICAGSVKARDIAGVPIGGYNDAEPKESAFLSPWAIARFRDGYMLSDPLNEVVRYFDDEKTYTAVGSGEAGYRDGFGVETQFRGPTGLAADDAGNIYIADTGNHLIRKLDRQGNVTTFAGSVEGCADGAAGAARFREPTGLCWAGGALYVADSGNHRVCRIENGEVATLAGPSIAPDDARESFHHGGCRDGAAAQAMFSNPQGVAVSACGDVYVADTGNGAIRKISGGRVSTITMPDSGDSQTYPVAPRGLLIADDTLYIADAYSGIVFREKLA